MHQHQDQDQDVMRPMPMDTSRHMVRTLDAKGKRHFLAACTAGALDLAQSVYASGKVVTQRMHGTNDAVLDHHGMITTALLATAKAGHLPVLRWLVAGLRAPPHTRGGEAFRLACGRAHLDVAAWLAAQAPGVAMDMARAAYRDATCRGDQVVLHWLQTMWGAAVQDTRGFFWACVYGHTAVAQYLVSEAAARTHPTHLLDTHIYDDALFVDACARGDLHQAQWLHSLGGVDVHTKLDAAFRGAIKKEHHPHYLVASWLVSLQPTWRWPKVGLSPAAISTVFPGSV
jgi:hypothetical protein